AVTFTIRTYVTRLRELVKGRPVAAAALASTLTTVPSETAAYKGWENLIEPLVAWLEAQAELTGRGGCPPA
ncbi:MAG: hypothetical protein J2O47_09695, partial [Acidimicrobiaceae bacterium]|nr:hypothetical protein [Acidimicrobiaceae bacterium]